MGPRLARSPGESQCPAANGEGGFGFDPIFSPDGETRTFAEMTVEEKGEISHRGRAMRKLGAFIEKVTLDKQTKLLL